MVRSLPGVFSSIQDLSTLPQGNSGILAVGIVLQANKGTLGQVALQTSSTDLLTNYSYSGTVKPNDDKSFHTALKTLEQTNMLYTARAYSIIDPPLYGGLVVKKEELLGNILSIVKTNGVVNATVTILGNLTSSVLSGTTLRLNGIPNTVVNKLVYITPTRLNVISSSLVSGNTVVIVTEEILSDYTYATGTAPKAYKTVQPVPFNQQLLGAITGLDSINNTLVLAGDVTAFFPEGDQIELKGSTGNDRIYTVISASYDPAISQDNTSIVVAENVANATADGSVFRSSIVSPNNYEFQPEDLYILTGKDQGSYNGDIKIKLVSSLETPDALTEANVMQITVYDALKNEQLELPFLTNRVQGSKATDGTSLYIEDVLINSAYIQAVNNLSVDETVLPCNTIDSVRMSGGYDGGALEVSDLVAALDLFADKVIPIDIMANGSGTLAETPEFQQALIALAESRQDIVAFINSRLSDEKLSTNSARAAAVASYKKSILASTSFYSAIYTPHVTISDTFNSRQIAVGADAIMIPGWLKVINSQGYPFAFAGYQYGRVSNMTATWRIGDQSGEASILNDASVNFIGYDAIQNTYLACTQNTLQIANSSVRNLGAVFNILDIKKTLSIYLKQYLQLPITTSLRKTIASTTDNYMDGVKASERISNYNFKDISSSTDISNNTLRFVLTISPANYAQQIYLVVRIVNQTFDFQILQNL